MSDVERILEWFDSGRLTRPDADAPNFVDLARAFLALGGHPQFASDPGARRILQAIPAADHYIFILVDGMGLNFVDSLDPSAFLRRRLAMRLQSVFMSTTAAALTSLATAEWPAAHGVPGWWVWLEEYRINATILPFIGRITKRPLPQFGVDPLKAFPVPSAWPRMTRDAATITLHGIVDSVYSHYSRGFTESIGYKDLDEALALARDRVLNAAAPTVTFVYLPQLDESAHHHGTRDARTLAILADLDRRIEALAHALAGRARIIVSADHGMCDIPEDRKVVLAKDDSLARMLVTQPTGEPQAPIFHVIAGCEQRFATEFRTRFGSLFALLPPDDVERLRLFGPAPLSAVMRRRLGTFLGIAPCPAFFYVRPTSSSERHIGAHAGLTPEQMTIPLIVT